MTKLSIFLWVADFISQAKLVFSWPAWVVYGFAVATKSSKPHSISNCCLTHRQVGEKAPLLYQFGRQIFKCWAKIVMTMQNQLFIPQL